jgi:O-methyltransferase
MKTTLPPLTPAAEDFTPTFFMDDDPLLPCAVGDVERVRALLLELRGLMADGIHFADNLLTWGRNMSAISDTAFQKAWTSNCVVHSDVSIMWRRYILCTTAYHCVQLDGDFVECGTLNGTGIKTIIDYFGKQQFFKRFWGYDTFDYNPVASHSFSGQNEGLLQRVLDRFATYPMVRIVPGLLPGSLIGASPERIAFLHIDLNSAEYEVNVLDALFERMVDGGVLILDDYEWSGLYRAQKIAEDAWFEQRQHRVIPLPTGQGMVIKHSNARTP